MTNNVIPCLWFDHQAEEAAAFYTSIFKSGEIGAVSHYTESSMMPAGGVMTVNFTISGQNFIALNGGPHFKFTPAASFFVGCQTVEELNRLWARLSGTGMVLMELTKYPFSERFGWIQDKYGLSWQLGLSGMPQYIAPFLMFTGEQYAKTEEAMEFYCSLFDNPKVVSLQHQDDDKTKSVVHAEFSLDGHLFMAMDSGIDHRFTFTEAVSFYVQCTDQAQIDKFWDTLSEGGEQQQCGWLRDRFGVSWQIVHIDMEKMMTDKDTEKVERVTQAMFKMKKIDIATLKNEFSDVKNLVTV